MKGSYCLVIEVEERTEEEVGALRVIEFHEGFYVYAGSAFGPGGLKRVERHRAVSRGERDTCQWHIDYLLSSENASIADVVKFSGKDIECKVSNKIQADGVPGFGCSDCGCSSHLFFQDPNPAVELERLFSETD